MQHIVIYALRNVVCLLVRSVSPAKTAELIEMPIGVWTWNYADGGPECPTGKDSLGGSAWPSPQSTFLTLFTRGSSYVAHGYQ